MSDHTDDFATVRKAPIATWTPDFFNLWRDAVDRIESFDNEAVKLLRLAVATIDNHIAENADLRRQLAALRAGYDTDGASPLVETLR